ncbi:hypothetical protein [Salinimicrobium sediminilitoris]|uniref:hypothetical protein n=1 Tax=Salinimicrobium sediminilitoris TaxID=2876715 RepID=UPI001E5DF28D|nr:hypothetical protein [Salinimicrobium sediminilitoris]MCC8358931.1 hypothetical protein [Salinimicrobium sediminilitoris]
MEIVKIEVGQERPLINKIGGWIFLIGILLLLISGGILFFGYYLPLELTLVYYLEFLHQNIYLTFILSLGLTFGGGWLMSWLKYIPTDLKINEGDIIFFKGEEEIELPTRKIHKLLWKKKMFSDLNNVVIKTIGLKKYHTRMDNMNYNRLTQSLPDKTSEYNYVG